MLFKELLESKKMSAYKLMSLSGVPKTTIMSLTRGDRLFKNITVDNAIKIAKALDMSVEDIYQLMYQQNQCTFD